MAATNGRPEQVGERGVGGLDGHLDALLGVASLDIETAEVVEVVESDGLAGCFDRRGRLVPPRTAEGRLAAMANERASFGSFSFDRPESSSRTQATSVAGTSRTSSPAVASCWANGYPPPPADSTAHACVSNAAVHWSNWLAAPGSHLETRQFDFAVIDRDRGVRPLVRIHSDHHFHRQLLPLDGHCRRP